MLAKRTSIAVNVRFLIKGKLEGIGMFTFESLKRIVATHPEVDFYFLFDRAYSPEFIVADNVTPVVLFPPARHPLLWYWWFEWSVAKWLNKNKPDLFLSADGYGCLSSNVPQVVVIHDLAFEHFNNHVPALTLKYYRHFTPKFASKAVRVATVSEYSRNDIADKYKIDRSKIDVVYNGAKESYHPLNDEQKVAVRNKYADGCPYFIYVGSIHPRKNIRNLILAFAEFKRKTNSEHKLLLVGRLAWSFKKVEQTLSESGFANDIILMGHQPPEVLAHTLAAAECMVYVSLFEGFGIPIIEAMSCGVPVITSNTTSMPEAAGNAALLVTPTNVHEIASAMEHIAGSSNLRNQLIAEGTVQTKIFTWDNTANLLWRCCEQALAKSSVGK